MNPSESYDQSTEVTVLDALLPEDLLPEIVKFAAVGLTPAQIAAAVKMVPGVASVFIELADTPGSPVARLIEQGRAEGMSTAMVKLKEAAEKGDVDVIKEFRALQARNRFQELVYYMDNDEFTG